MSISRAFLLALAITLLVLPVAGPTAALARAAGEENEHHYEWRYKDHWLVIETDVVGLALSTRRPFFAWWYVGDNSTVYVAHYRGLVEYLFWPKHSMLDPYSWAEEMIKDIAENTTEAIRRELNRLLWELVDRVMALHRPVDPAEIENLMNKTREAMEMLNTLYAYVEAAGEAELAQMLSDVNATLTEMLNLMEQLKQDPSSHWLLMQLKHKAGELRTRMIHTWAHMMGRCHKRMLERAHKLREKMSRMGVEAKFFHPPFFSFSEGRWELDGPHELKGPEGDVIGLWFTYKLVEVFNPRFRFAENNIMIRCRLYLVPVQEVAPGGLNYTVLRAELKQDLVILKWVWNRDLLRAFYKELGIPWPEELSLSSSGLALRLELLALNASRIAEPYRLCEELTNSSGQKAILSALVREAKQVRHVVLGACDEVEELIGTVLEALYGGASVEDVADRLDEALLAVQQALMALMLHEELIAKLDELAQEELDPQAYSELGGLINTLEGLIGDAKEFLTGLNATLTELVEGTPTPDELMSALENLKTEISGFKESFRGQVDALIDQLEDLIEEAGSEARRWCRCTHVRIGGQVVDIRHEGSLEREKRFTAGVRLREPVKMQFATENTTLAGWFKFVNASILTYPDGHVEVRPVRLAYLESGRVLHVFLVYGYFDGATLEHDPSTGLDVPETAEQTPVAQVEVPSGGETEPELPGGGPGPGPYVPTVLLSPEVLVVVGVGLVAVGIVVAALKRRGRTINLS